MCAREAEPNLADRRNDDDSCIEKIERIHCAANDLEMNNKPPRPTRSFPNALHFIPWRANQNLRIDSTGFR